jgi:hypothetical protein
MRIRIELSKIMRIRIRSSTLNHIFRNIYPEMADEKDVTQDRLKVGLVHHAEGDGLAAASSHALNGCHRAECLLGRQLSVLLEKIV